MKSADRQHGSRTTLARRTKSPLAIHRATDDPGEAYDEVIDHLRVPERYGPPTPS